MRFQRIKEEVLYKPWLITAAGHQLILDILEAHGAMLYNDDKCGDWKPKRDDDYNDDEDEGEEKEPMLLPSRPAMKIDPFGIAHIAVMGVLGRKLGLLEKACGNTDYVDIEKEIEIALQSQAKGIMFHIDSPGGTVTGNSEIVEIVQSLPIPSVSYVDSQACSAAYNIACSTKAIFATQSALVGSIGTLIPWVDKSKMWAEEGMLWDPITNQAGDLKATGHGPSLTPEQRQSLQELAEDAFADFKENVLRNRSVPAVAMRGQAFYAKRALQNNLIDGISTEVEAYDSLVFMV